MAQHHVTKAGKCIYCGAKLRQCIECGDWFIATNKNHIYCRSRCRTRRYRKIDGATLSVIINPGVKNQDK